MFSAFVSKETYFRPRKELYNLVLVHKIFLPFLMCAILHDPTCENSISLKNLEQLCITQNTV